MKRKEEEKNKVGRPKLADDELKKKSYIMLGVALLLVISLTFGGLFSLTNVRLGNLKGAATEKPANPAFDDINFYKCVVDTYNEDNRTNISYKTKLTDNQLDKISTLSCSSLDSKYNVITSIKGIEKLTNLGDLGLYYNDIKSIDLSKNINLKWLFLSNNKLTKLNLSKNINLTHLDIIGDNKLTKLDLSKNINLKWLQIADTKLTSIDLSKNVKLETLYLDENELTKIALSKNLTSLSANSNKLANLNLRSSLALEYLAVGSNNIKSIDLSKNVNLKTLNLEYNKLTNIDLSKNINLTSLDLSNNNLTSVVISKNTKLAFLDLYPQVDDHVVKDIKTLRIIKGARVKSPVKISDEILNKLWEEIKKPFKSSIAKYSNGYWTGTKVGEQREKSSAWDLYCVPIKVFDLASEKYKIDKQNKYVYVEDDTDKEVLNNIKVSSNASKRVEKGYFYVMDKEDKVVVEKYKIVRVVSKNYKLLTSKDKTKKYIYTKSNGFNKNNIKLENCTLQQNGKESIIIKYGNTVLGEYRILNVCNAVLANNGSYKVSCEEDDAKINKVYQYISDEEKTLSAKEGKISVEESNSDRGAVVKVDYTYKGKKYTDESNLITIPRSASFKHETEETYCKVYITGVNNSKVIYSVRCDANAKPSKIEMYEKETNLGIVDKNYKEHYGLYEDNRSVDFSKYRLSKGKEYVIRIAYNFVDNGKVKYDYYRSSFKAGENKKEEMPSVVQDDTQKCAIKIASAGKGSIKYNIACNKNARPNSVRITTKYNNRPFSKVSKKMIVNHKSIYLNGKEQTMKEELSVINNFGTKAQNVGALSYGMKEEGTITNLDKGEYRLLFYYAIKDSSGKVITNYVRTYSNLVNVN